MKRLILVQVLFSLLVTVTAQSGVGLSPPRVEYQALPGTAVVSQVHIDNPSQSDALRVNVNLNDVLFQPDGSTVFLPAGSHPNSATGWLSVNPLQFVLQPGQAEEIGYSLDVPPGTPDGSYWAVLFFQSGPTSEADDQAGIGIRTQVRVGHIVYVDVGDVSREGRITGMRYEPGGSRPASVRVAFSNTGNGVTRVEGQVEVRSLEGELVRTLSVPENATFPGYTRELEVFVGEPLEPGEYVALAVLDYGGSSLITGQGRLEVQ